MENIRLDDVSFPMNDSILSSSFSTDLLLLNKDSETATKQDVNHLPHHSIHSNRSNTRISQFHNTHSQFSSFNRENESHRYLAQLALCVRGFNGESNIYPLPITHHSNIVNIYCCQDMFVIQYSDNGLDLYGSFHMMDYTEPVELNLSQIQTGPLLISYFKNLNENIVDVACTDSCIIVLLPSSIYQIHFQYHGQNQFNSSEVGHQIRSSIPTCVWRRNQWSIHIHSIPYIHLLQSSSISITESQVRFRGITSNQNSYCIYTEEHGLLFKGPVDIPNRSFSSLANSNSLQAVQRIDDLPVSKLHCNDTYVAFITQEGKLHSFGIGVNGQLGHKNPVSISIESRPVHGVEGVKDFVCCGRFMVCLCRSGSVYYWGELPNGHFFQYPTLLHVSSCFSHLFKSQNSLYVLCLTETSKVFCIGSVPFPSSQVLSIQQVNEFVVEVTFSWNKKLSSICCGRKSIMLATESLCDDFVKIDNIQVLQRENEKLIRDQRLMRHENSQLNLELQELRISLKAHVSKLTSEKPLCKREHVDPPGPMDYSQLQNQLLEVEEIEDVSMSIRFDQINKSKNSSKVLTVKTDEDYSFSSEGGLSDSFVSEELSDEDTEETLAKYRQKYMLQEQLEGQPYLNTNNDTSDTKFLHLKL